MITSLLKQLIGSGLASRLKCQNSYLNTTIVDFSLVLAFSSDVRHFKDDIMLVTVKLTVIALTTHNHARLFKGRIREHPNA